MAIQTKRRSSSRISSRVRGGGSRSAKYQMPKDAKIEYKNIQLLQKYISDRGKILSRRITGVTGKNQRELTEAIKRARYLALLPVGGAKRKRTV